jgi:hypothetical protein
LTSERLPVKEVMGRLDHLVEAVYERYKDPCRPNTWDLKIATNEVNAADGPTKYLYKVQILEEEKPEGRDKHTASTEEDRAKVEWQHHGSADI